MTLKDRIKQLRKSVDLTQQEFAKRIGTSQNVLANYEIGRRNPSNSVINNICKTFHVNEQWLRTGKGEPFLKEDTFSLDEFAKQQGATELEFLFLKSYFALPATIRQQLFNDFKEQIGATNPKTSEISPVIEPVENSDELSVSEPVATADLVARLDALERKNAALERRNAHLEKVVKRIQQEDALEDSRASPALPSNTA